ncbi:activating signal cointegrator 1 complex subunit 1 [Latimeria chalumnae]|uniref:Activating signal cointegrator 1 complex subunit 1 n=1 Tax=Latimeria chalumnae TaxID=7897 RepID=H3BD53_LATCH|nr:PREDICTED: activating signal cointegrator 1 complex subunit 1 [Latimeria chalumnae]XP_005991424.1 PREDICTED: activating signal cointegrator 1 complex subunit 1 [Latimeria chalumnae]XP_005991425.1 PREDICTED: activating signal cointegrator 1 complex subunit 1 [Latimeria chalumnae]XP_005991426.1 PREDICTED: activating signal cointegrator 1 complex subunit 1 [Latimeria chalumnae]|eukprot:XP_005991423.1 PREDICTED: activating signal cointegrator 1 complex subunit 1 [Latimeria chalumnae]
MEVLRPTLVNIGGCIYRKNPIKEQSFQTDEDEYSSYSGATDYVDEACDTVAVEQTEKGYRCSMNVASVLYKYIIGKKGETRRRLETETRTSISIPKPGVEGEIVITGQQRTGVVSARTRIEVLVESFRKKQPFTHFLSIALNQSDIQERFQQFKKEVLEKCSKDRGIDTSIFQNPAKLHLTIGTLVLLNEQEVRAACELLQQCKQDFIDNITGGKPIKLELTGTEYMNDDPAMVDVLYAKVHGNKGSEKLQLIVDMLMERFVHSGLMLKEWDKVKLHTTIMNTLFRKDSSSDMGSLTTGKQDLKGRGSFDARNVLKLSEKYHFGELELNTVHISQRFSTDGSGYYSSSGLVTFS